MLSRFKFRLLGGYSITFDGQELTTVIPGVKAKLLLACLILAYGMPLSRKQLAFDFWMDSTERQALTNLRKLLHDLRESLPYSEQVLIVTATSLAWNTEWHSDSDVHEFELAAASSSIAELRRAEQLYQGELLHGYYEDWLDTRRRQMAQAYVNVLEKLIAMSESMRDYASALQYAQKLLIKEPLREDLYRTIMRLQAQNRDLAGVAQTYRDMCATWREELGITPAAETIELADQILKGEVRASMEATQSQALPLIGRIPEWGRLQDAWKQATTGSNTMVLIQGESGIGKTRLALELQTLVDNQGYRTVFAGCYPAVRSLAYSPVIAWLRSIPVPVLSPIWLSELSRLLPELAEKIPDLPRPGPIQESWQLRRWYEAIERMLSSSQPLLLIVDDIQWSDSETLQLLAYLLRGNSGTQVLLVATMRIEEQLDDSVRQLLSSLDSERKLTRMKLAPFTEEETKQLLSAVVGEQLASSASPGMYARTGGNPLFIVETLQEWRAGGSNGEPGPSPLVRSVMENRIGKLSRDNRRLVLLLSTVGRPISAALLAALSGWQESALLEAVEQLVRLNLCHEDGDGFIDFTHRLIMETAYGMVSASRRRQCHRQIAEGLAAYYDEHTESFAGEIAFHYEAAGMEQKAIEYYEWAARVAESMRANETRIRYYRKLSQLLPSERLLSNLTRLGDALILAGHWEEAETTYRQWLACSGSSATIEDRSYCLAALGNCLRLQGRYEEARSLLEQAHRYFELMSNAEGLGVVTVRLGTLYYYRGDYDQALIHLNKSIKLFDHHVRSREKSLAYGILGHLYYDRCEYDQALAWLQQQMALAARNGDSYSVEQAMGTIAMVYMDTDEMQLAFDLLMDKMQISSAIGDRMGYAIAHGMLGKYYGELGHDRHAVACSLFCLEEAIAVQDWRIAAIMLSYAGRSLLAMNRSDEAAQLLDRSMQLLQRLHAPYFTCEALYYFSLVQRFYRQFEIAASVAENAYEMADQLGRRDMQVRLLILLTELKFRLGRMNREEAGDLLRRQLERTIALRDQGALLYALWKLNPDTSGHRDAALRLNEELYSRSRKREYYDRCLHIKGYAEAAAPGTMPLFAAERMLTEELPSEALKAIDCYLTTVVSDADTLDIVT